MTGPRAPGVTERRLGSAIPILSIRSLPASLDYYVNALGFRLDWQDGGIIASVSRGDCSLFLCEGDQGNPVTWVWIGVDDIEPLHEELRAKGARVRNPPTNYWWAYEMQVEDPDGHVLRFGSDAKPDRPHGLWRDMRGDLWERTEAGTWSRVEER